MSTDTKTKFSIRSLSVILSCILLLSFAGCNKKKDEVLPADYGSYGADFAKSLAEAFPYRSAFSAGEQGAGIMIKNELERIGYQVEAEPLTDASGNVSYNYIVRIPGEGFMQRDSFGEYAPVKKTVVIGAHYDSPVSFADRENYPDYDGIQNNACGVGALLTIAKAMYGQTYGYDVILVFFCASSNNYLGTGVFLTNMKDEEIKTIECMYCIESIYAGDKLYAHAGLSSLKEGKKYSYRRKLYEAYDVAYENMLQSKTGVDLCYNMSLLSFDVNGDSKIDMYREITMVQSDYTLFDSQSIPIVFLESSDYNYTKLEDMKETKNLQLQEYGGAIRGTPLDSSKLLGEALDEDRLQTRINVTAFIVVKAVEKGSQNCITISKYEAGERLEPTVAPKKKNEESSASEESK